MSWMFATRLQASQSEPDDFCPPSRLACATRRCVFPGHQARNHLTRPPSGHRLRPDRSGATPEAQRGMGSRAESDRLHAEQQPSESMPADQQLVEASVPASDTVTRASYVARVGACQRTMIHAAGESISLRWVWGKETRSGREIGLVAFGPGLSIPGKVLDLRSRFHWPRTRHATPRSP